ncbi:MULTISPECIES: pantoate--beta-alanine ligase [Arthrobacter]|uniref:Pantothenate synthetase n=2 Tax=Arthrobacter TaxID=1663 RepID=A0ABU9KIN5_9MICC|nr:pantoate--beta-alanine ligase [Arthrobacter sp. YJM1]MDP5226997.1 pantoate--beta-alanine ligase [Arthrobacter sp. YJM1]
MGIELITTTEGLRTRLAELSQAERLRSAGFVPTMGALHSGHAALARRAAEENDLALASIFVNPLQFGEAVDLERYPRTLDADLELLDAAGVRLAFAPSVEEMYPYGEPGVRVTAGPLAAKWEGASRPGHFDGALTVVAKLLHLAHAPVPVNRAYFGQKDAQQLTLVQQMVDDLNLDVQIVPVPIVRDADGLALSSRNRFLSEAERESALVLSRALRLLEERAAAHEPLDLDSAVALVQSAPGVELDYFEVVDPRTLEPLAENCEFTPFRGEGLAIVAAKVGPVRLIDNAVLSS